MDKVGTVLLALYGLGSSLGGSPNVESAKSVGTDQAIFGLNLSEPYDGSLIDFEAGKHYPSTGNSNNNIDYVFTSTGPPGSFCPPSFSPQLTDPFEYNYCLMPRVHTSTYIRPDPDQYQLVYVEIIHRHHKRTPYGSNIFWQESTDWDCTPFLVRKFGRSDFRSEESGAGSIDVRWKSWKSGVNPWEGTIGTGFGDGGCLFPQLTDGGLEDSYDHGRDLKAVYGDILGFLPSEFDHQAIKYRATTNDITSQVLGALIKGMYPDLDRYDALIQPASVDSLEPSFSCPRANQLKAAMMAPSNARWAEHLRRAENLFARLDAVSGVENPDERGWHSSFDHYYDNMSSKQCHGKPLPCNVNNTDHCIAQEDADTVYRLGQYEYSHLYRDDPLSLEFSALKMSPFFLELKYHILERLSGGNIRYWHNSAHDGSIAAVLGFLQVDEMVWPGMGSQIAFEVYANKEKNHFIRVLWKGRPMVSRSPLGRMDMIPLEMFFTYLDAYILADPVGACNTPL